MSLKFNPASGFLLVKEYEDKSEIVSISNNFSNSLEVYKVLVSGNPEYIPEDIIVSDSRAKLGIINDGIIISVDEVFGIVHKGMV